MFDTRDEDASIGIWTGAAASYDAWRPHPPRALLDLLARLAGVARPRLVVDLGSGTGLSTVLWAERAEEVVGIEPNDDMRATAIARAAALPGAGHVRFQPGRSRATGLPAGSADILTISQALHWMEPEPTFAEVARVLRPGGLFAAYDYEWPPMISWQADDLFHGFQRHLFALADARDIAAARLMSPAWAKSEHLARMRASGHFRHTREVLAHAIEEGDAERFVGLTLSSGADAFFARGLLTAAEAGVEAFRAAVRAALGDAPAPWHFSYHVRLARK
ncbi:MAG: methyltransferase domain-containing protein [Ktedonobacterales bacterium]|nr:methyltransferase domain-containing protein [Ktedonobacterales bacterium]